MADVNGTNGNGHARRGVKFDATIRIDTLIACFVMAVGVIGTYFALKGDVNTNARDIEKLTKVVDIMNDKKADKETVGRAEVDLSRRIVEQQREANTLSLNISEGFREVKGILRDLDQKLERKADKPGR